MRQAAAREEILAAAWQLARANGLAGLSLRDLGAAVGMKAQSLYSYFPSKHAIYDAMFRQGYETFLGEAVVDTPSVSPAVDLPAPARAEAVESVALAGALAFFDFCTADPVRYQLLFQRVLPDFEPSAASMAVALQAYQATVGQLAEIGVTDQAGLDLWTAMVTGLVDQQLSNDPGGTRWRELVPRAVHMMLAEHDRFDHASDETRSTR